MAASVWHVRLRVSRQVSCVALHADNWEPYNADCGSLDGNRDGELEYSGDMRFGNALAIFALALVTGATAGLSVSPVAPTLVTGLGVVIFAVVGIRGLSIEPLNKIIAVPAQQTPVNLHSVGVASIALGLAAGLILGVIARTHYWLVPSTQLVISRYQRADVKEGEIVRALMAAELASTHADGKASGGSTVTVPLFSSPLAQTSCVELRSKLLRQPLSANDLVNSNHPGFRVLGEVMNFQSLDARQINRLVTEFCPESRQ